MHHNQRQQINAARDDAFNGVYLARRLQGDGPEKAAQNVLLVASRVVAHAGAIIPASASHPVGPYPVDTGSHEKGEYS